MEKPEEYFLINNKVKTKTCLLSVTSMNKQQIKFVDVIKYI